LLEVASGLASYKEMTMNMNRFSFTTGLLIAVSISAAQAGVKRVGAASDEALDTLKTIEHSAVMIEAQADEFKAISENIALDPKSHLAQLLALKDKLNRAGQEISRLENESAAPWEQQAIAKAGPLLADAAMNTRKAIEYFNEHQDRLWTVEYRGYAEKINRDSMEAAKTLREYLNLAQTRNREERLEQQLGTIDK